MKYIFDDAKFTTLVSEYKDSLHENPAAMAAAAMAATKIRNDQGKQIQAKTALANRDHPQHKKAKGLFSRLMDKFKKKQEVNEISAAEVLDDEVITYKDDKGNEKDIKAISAYNDPDHPEHDRAKAMYDKKRAGAIKAKAKKTGAAIDKGFSSAASKVKKGIGSVASMQKESTKEYEKSLRKIAMDRQMKMLTKKDKQTLLKLAKLMQKESINESIADEDMKAAKKLKSGLEKQIKSMAKEFDNIEKKVSSFNAPGLKAAYADAIKKSFQGNKFNPKLAINLLDAYFNR